MSLVDFLRQKARLANLGHHSQEILGLDETSLKHLGQAERLYLSFPHASCNVFFPRVGATWLVAQLLSSRWSYEHHLRVVLTHTNLSDLGWRPYGFWYLSELGSPQIHRWRSRNRKYKHLPVRGQEGLTIENIRGLSDWLVDLIRPSLGRENLAESFMIVNGVIERICGLTRGYCTTYIPLEWLVEYVLSGGAYLPASAESIRSSLARSTVGRKVDGEGKLVSCDIREAEVFDNFSNLALACLLQGEYELTLAGGPKMPSYRDAILSALGEMCPTYPIPDIVHYGDARLGRQDVFHSKLRKSGCVLPDNPSQLMAFQVLGPFGELPVPYSQYLIRGGLK